MILKSKYQPVLDLGEKYNVKDGYVKEEDGKLKIGGMAKTQYQKDRMWDKIKEISGGGIPADLEADIKVADNSAYHYHTVEKGETLGKIANQYYSKPSLYTKIFEANRDILDDADVIHPGQELVIPFK